MAKLRVAAVVIALLLTACGRVPLGNVPNPSSGSTPTIDASPVAGEAPTSLPTVSSKPTTPPKESPRSTPTTIRGASPTPTLPPLVVAGGTLPGGEVGISYAATSFSATGGNPPYTWSISAGSIPGGLSLSGNSVSGTPTASGTSSFTIRATDVAGHTATSPRSITIQPPLVLSGSCDATQCVYEAGCVTVCGTLGSQSGGVAPYKYAALGALPTGMGLSTLTLTGPFPAGSWKFGVEVQDALGATASIAAAFDIFPHIALANGSCSQKAGSDLVCQIRMPYSAGTGKPRSVTLNPKTPGPKGTTAVLQSGIVLVTIPAQAVPTSGKLQIILDDSAVCGPAAGQFCRATATATFAFS